MKQAIPAVLLTATSNIAVAQFMIDGNLLAAFAALVSTVVATLAVAKWIDSRIQHKLQNHAAIESLEHRAILTQVSILRELLGHPPINADDVLRDAREAG